MERVKRLVIAGCLVFSLVSGCNSAPYRADPSKDGTVNSYICPQNAQCVTFSDGKVTVHYKDHATLNAALQDLPSNYSIIRMNAVESGRTFFTVFNQPYRDLVSIVSEYSDARNEIIDELLVQVNNTKTRQMSSVDSDADYINALQSEIDKIELLKETGVDSNLLVSSVTVKGE